MPKLLIIADIEDKCSATPRGLELAAKLGLSAEVVAFTYESLAGLKVSASQKTEIRKRLLDQREQVVQARIDKYRAQEQKVTLNPVWEKDLHSWVNKRCASGRYLAVVKTGHRSDSLLHTSLDWQLLRECPAPVLIVAAKKWHRARPVLAALDLASNVASKQALNVKVLGEAAKLAAALGVPLEVVGAIEVPVLLADLDLIDEGAYVRQAKAEMKPRIQALAEAQGIPDSAFLIKRGPVERVIASRAARIGAQIVVLGTVGRKGVKARLLGNTAERVLQHMKTDVLVIKP